MFAPKHSSPGLSGLGDDITTPGGSSYVLPTANDLALRNTTRSLTQSQPLSEQEQKDIAVQYGGINTVGKYGSQVVGMYAPLGPLAGMAAKTILGAKLTEQYAQSGVIGQKFGPIVQGVVDFWTLGLNRLPVFQNILGHLFSKATHFEDCMKWWSDGNIRSMVVNYPLYPIDIDTYIAQYAPQFRDQYNMMKQNGNWDKTDAPRLLAYSTRWEKFAGHFLSLTRQNPDIFKAECAAMYPEDVGGQGPSRAEMDQMWTQVKEAARQQEWAETSAAIDKIINYFGAPSQTWALTQAARAANSLIDPMTGEVNKSNMQFDSRTNSIVMKPTDRPTDQALVTMTPYANAKFTSAGQVIAVGAATSKKV